MKTARSLLLVLPACAIALAPWSTYGFGADYPNDRPVGGTSAWPDGLTKLVNTTNRIHGFFVNTEDVFFFVGDAAALTGFLHDYARIRGVEKHRLVLHEGVGEAKSPWGKEGRLCDWKLNACPKSWRTTDPAEKAFMLEVHFWTGGKIALNQVRVPSEVEVVKSK